MRDVSRMGARLRVLWCWHAPAVERRGAVNYVTASYVWGLVGLCALFAVMGFLAWVETP